VQTNKRSGTVAYPNPGLGIVIEQFCHFNISSFFFVSSEMIGKLLCSLLNESLRLNPNAKKYMGQFYQKLSQKIKQI